MLESRTASSHCSQPGSEVEVTNCDAVGLAWRVRDLPSHDECKARSDERGREPVRGLVRSHSHIEVVALDAMIAHKYSENVIFFSMFYYNLITNYVEFLIIVLPPVFFFKFNVFNCAQIIPAECDTKR